MKMKRILGILIHLIVFSSLKITALGIPKTKHLTVVFRHGDRAPDSTTAEKFPNDPYVNDPFYPGGPGGLTNAGKLRAYQLGEVIRRNYNDFLGDIYSPSEVFARSTDIQRTVMTLHLVMAGAFPPSQAQKWHSTLNWQPVIANFEIGAHNFLPLLCPAYYNEVERVKNTPEVRERIDAFKEYIQYISQAAGKEIKTLKDMALLYHALTAESAMGLELRGWALEAFNNGTLLSATLLDYETTNYNARIKTLNGGRLLKYIVNNMTGIIEGTSKVKLNLFSGHETNVVALLSTLGVFKPHMPTYSSAVFVELLEDRSDHFVKVQYYKGNPPVFEELTIPGCTAPCPFETFKILLKDVTPTDDDMHCRTL